MKQLNLLGDDLEALQQEIWDVHKYIRDLEKLRDTLYKERKAICPHELKFREDYNGNRLFPKGKFELAIPTPQQFCGVCKKLMKF